jgi:LPS-assembly lipoprotein
MRRKALKLLAAAGLAVLAGCGFQLRGQALLPFQAAYVEAAGRSPLAAQLRRQLDLKGKLAERREAADVIIRLTGEKRDKSILSLSGAGKVREYRLNHGVTLVALAPDGSAMLAEADVKQSRDFSYSDEQILAKEAEENMLRKDMDDEIVRQILRRLAFVRR